MDYRFPIPQPPDLNFELPEITPLSHWLSGEAAFQALQQAVEALARTAPEGHDVLVSAFGLTVLDIRFVEPHTFIFKGLNAQGHDAFVVVHHSQLVAHVVYLPKKGPQRVVTGFQMEAQE